MCRELGANTSNIWMIIKSISRSFTVITLIMLQESTINSFLSSTESNSDLILWNATCSNWTTNVPGITFTIKQRTDVDLLTFGQEIHGVEHNEYHISFSNISALRYRMGDLIAGLWS